MGLWSTAWLLAGRLNPFKTSVGERLLDLGATAASGPLFDATYIRGWLVTLCARESHWEARLETNSSTIACSVLLISIMGRRSMGAVGEDVCTNGIAGVRLGSVVISGMF